MPRYYVECHEDGDFVPTHQLTIEAANEDIASREALLDMYIKRGRVDEIYDDADEERIIGYEGLATCDGAVCKEEMLDIVYDEGYVDVCIEIPDGLPGEAPWALEAAVDELLNNRQHLDLHEDDRTMLENSLKTVRDVRLARALSSGGIC